MDNAVKSTARAARTASPGSGMTIQEKLENCQARIAAIRTALADASLLTEIQVDGLSEKIDRRALREELKELEAEETRLLDELTGRNSRLIGIQMRR